MDGARFEAELASRPTADLEQMYFRDVETWTEEARSIILKALEQRPDRRIGIVERYCPSCKRLNDFTTLICPCGFDFHAGIRPAEAIAADRKRSRRTRLSGFVLSLVAGLYALFRWEVLIVDAGHSHPPVLFGFWLLILGCGLYMLLTGSDADPSKVAGKVLRPGGRNWPSS